MYVKISCMCLIDKAKFFRRFIAVAMDRVKAEVLAFNDVQIK